jgi:hypothetical protein
VLSVIDPAHAHNAMRIVIAHDQRSRHCINDHSHAKGQTGRRFRIVCDGAGLEERSLIVATNQLRHCAMSVTSAMWVGCTSVARTVCTCSI